MACCKCDEYGWEKPQHVVYSDMNGKEYCLFHAPAEHKEMSVKEFNARVWERVQATTDLGDKNAQCNFSGTIFPGDISFVSVSSFPAISFQGSRFNGDATFREVGFVGCTDFSSCFFGGKTDFSSSVFGELADFSSSKFEGGANYISCEFGGAVDFSGSNYNDFADFSSGVFKKGIAFNNSKIVGNASFSSCEFGDDANFYSSVFGGDTSFREARFGGSAGFKDAHFSQSALFFKAQFEERDADFNLAHFKGQVNFCEVDFGGHAIFAGVNFNSSAAYKAVRFARDADFSATFFNGRATFSESRFEGRSIFSIMSTSEKANLIFAGCTISPVAITFDSCDPTCLDLTRQYDLEFFRFIESPWDKEGKRIKARTEDVDALLQPTRDFYQRMKSKYKAENNEYEASKWHIAEKEVQRKLLRQNGESKALRIVLFLYRWSSRFGEDPVLAGGGVLGFIMITWLLLGLGGIVDGERLIQGPTLPDSWESIANFGTVFMTLFKKVMLLKKVEFESQYGLIKGIVLILTRLVIPLQATLFAFALRNRFRR